MSTVVRRTTIWMVSLWCLALILFAALDATAATRLRDQASSNQHQSPDTAEEEEPGRAYALFLRVFKTPQAHRWNVSLAGGWALRDTAYRDTKALIYLRGHLDRRLTRTLNGFISVDHIDYSTRAAKLNYSNTYTMIGAGAAYVPWLGHFNLDFRLELGALVRTSSLSDGFGTERFRMDVKPGATAWAGLGLAFFGRSTFSARAGVRYHPGRLDYLGLFSLEFYFGEFASLQPGRLRPER